MAVLHVNNYSSTIVGAISNSDTVIEVNSATNLPSPTGGDYFTLTLDDTMGSIEIVKCTSRTGTSLTVVRGQEGTNPLAWGNFSLIENRLTANTIDSKITELSQDPSPQLSNFLDANEQAILNNTEIRTSKVTSKTDNFNYIQFTTSRQTFSPFNSDTMNITTAGIQLGGTNSRVNSILDEDDLISNSNSALVTQQSVKAYIDSFGQQRVKAWGTYNQVGGLSVLDSYNIASISDDAVGTATITFSTPLGNANYSVVAMGTHLPGGDKPGAVVYAEGVVPTASSFSLESSRGGGDLRDMPRVSFIVIGD